MPAHSDHLHSDLWAIPPHLAEEIFRQLHARPESAPALASPAPLATASSHNDEPSPAPGYTVQRGIAVISVSGTLTRTGLRHWYTGQMLTQGQDLIRKAIAMALADASVRGILFSFNSPGGEVPGTKELADYIAEAATQKPCAAYVDGLCASAAYWLAASTGRVLSPATGTVGSVGVIMVHTDCSRLNERIGITCTTIASGKWKDAGSDTRPLNDEERAYFAERVTAIHTLFKADVQSRMSLAAPEANWAEAQIFLADEARRLGLVSAIVRDEDEAVTTLLQETLMDKTTLAAQHPQLLTAITAEARAEARAEAEAEAMQQMQATLAVVKAVVAPEQYTAISSVMELCASSGLTPAQMTALAPVMAAKVAPTATAPAAQPPANPTATQPPANPMAAQAPATPTPPPPSSSSSSGESAIMSGLLAALQAATPAPLAADPASTTQPSAKSPLVADAERRAVSGQQRM